MSQMAVGCIGCRTLELTSKAKALAFALENSVTVKDEESSIDLERADQIFNFICERIQDLPSIDKNPMEESLSSLGHTLSEMIAKANDRKSK